MLDILLEDEQIMEILLQFEKNDWEGIISCNYIMDDSYMDSFTDSFRICVVAKQAYLIQEYV